MRYTEFRDAIHAELQSAPDGLTWIELKRRLRLPYSNPCPEWIRQMAKEIGLTRTKANGRAYTWQVDGHKRAARKH